MLLSLSVVDHSTPLLLSPQWPCILYSLFALHSGGLNFVCQWTRRTTRRGTRPWTASSTTRLSSTLTMKESSSFIIVQIIMIDYQDLFLKIRAVLISNKKGCIIHIEFSFGWERFKNFEYLFALLYIYNFENAINTC